MKPLFRKTLRVFKYLTLLFTVVFWVGILIDDYPLYSQYWQSTWREYLIAWTVYFAIYFAVFSLIYWVLAVNIIWLYLILAKPEEMDNRNRRK